MAFVFFSTEVILSVVVILFSILMWYLLLNCGIKYEVLGNQLKQLSVMRAIDDSCTSNQRSIAKIDKRNVFLRDLITGIETHKDLIK